MRLIKKIIIASALLMVAFQPMLALADVPVAGDTTDSRNTLQANNPNNGFGNTTRYVNVSGDFGCSLTATSKMFATCLASIVYYIGPGLASWVVSTAAYYFDLIVQLSLNSTAYALGFITSSWSLVLNLANMFFIFILIYTAFIIMLKAETTRTMQTLAWVIAIALVVNFSFFFTRIVIDTGNILAVQFYNAITLNAPTIGNGTPDLTANIMDALKVQQLLGPASFQAAQNATGDNNPWGALIISSMVYLSVAFILWLMAITFITVGIKFLLRIVGLWFVIISSPLAFVSKTLKNTEGYYNAWQDMLIKFSFYPVVFLFMFFILNQFVVALTGGNLVNEVFNGISAAGTDAASGSTLVTAIANVFIRMGFIVSVFYVALKASDWVVQEGTGVAHSVMSYAGNALRGSSGLAFRGAAGTGAWAGRNTAGRLAYRAADSTTLKNWAGRSAIGNALWRGTAGLSKATFDVRNAPGGGLLKKGTAKIIGDVNVGKAVAKSFDKGVKEREDTIKKRAEALKSTETEKERAGKDAQVRYESTDKGNDKEIERLKNTRSTYLRNATDKKGPTPFDARIAKLEEDREKGRKTAYEAGRKSVEAAQKDRINALADRYGKSFTAQNGLSPGNIKGAAAAHKVAKGKSAQDEVFDKLKEIAAAEAEHAPATPAGGGAPTGGGGHTSTPTPAAAGGGHGKPGAGGSPFTKAAGTDHALEHFAETMHKDLHKLRQEQHKTTEAIREASSHTSPVHETSHNTKKLVEQVSDGVADRLRENAIIPVNTRELKNTSNPITATRNMTNQSTPSMPPVPKIPPAADNKQDDTKTA